MKFNQATQLLLSLSLISLPLVSLAEADSLAPIIVSDDAPNPNFQTYAKPSAVSSRSTNQHAMQNLDSIVRSVSGAYTQMDPSQGAISVNIRGTAGLGRVNTLIDGVPQTAFGTSAKSSKFHGGDKGNGPTSQFGALIDQNFLTKVDISKGHSSGAAGLNSLSGSADFKTIDAEDVILDDNKVGILTKYNYGDNDLGKNGMVAVAGKTKVLSTGSVSGLFAFSKHKLSQNYKKGDGTYSSDTDYYTPLEQRPESYMAKLTFKPDQFSELKASARTYKNNIGNRDIKNKTYSLEGKYNPTNPLINLSFLAATTKTTQDYGDDGLLWTINHASTLNKMHYFDLHNESEFKFKPAKLSVTYGINYFNNKYSRDIPANGNDSGAISNVAFGPAGTQKIYSGYINSELNWGKFTALPELTYSRYKLSGTKPACDEDDAIYCVPPEAMGVKNQHDALNPSLTLAYEVTDWFQPFVSYYRTTRTANVQEVFNTSRNGLTAEPNLRPEKAKTYEIGFNINKPNFIVDNDYLGMKVNYFNSRIKDFIFNQSYYFCGTFFCNDVRESSETVHIQKYANSDQLVKSRGWEVELNYDSDYVFSNISYTRTTTTAPLSRGASILGGFGSDTFTHPPKDYADIEIGTRLFDKKLEISSLIKYTGQAKRIAIEQENELGQVFTEDLPKIPVIIDLNAQYKFNKHVTLKAGIQNLMNKNYMDALNTYNSSTDEAWDEESESYKFTNSARGRTYTVGLEVRF